ncbi:hypothetical protein BDV59DRAFT_195852 [Aspergillus ambiguus]|uniref:uncharacterized protein n=1 Tax=Aspergillus ambiguus TaxID=176160 RepID=UPI003CCCF711
MLSGPCWDGGITIVNNLDIDIYLRSDYTSNGRLQILRANGTCYHETWRPTANRTGVSIKVAAHPDLLNVLQFEYSAIPPMVWWDVSCIDLHGDPAIVDAGFAVTPTTSGSCLPVVCRAGEHRCPDVYYKPDDDFAVRTCSVDIWLTMEIGI